MPPYAPYIPAASWVKAADHPISLGRYRIDSGCLLRTASERSRPQIASENRLSMTVRVTIKYENGIMPGAE
jgi:hypothetical protein